MNLRFIDWIWHVRGSLALVPGQSGNDAIDRLALLFEQRGTSHERSGDTLTFRKRDQDAQDKMAVFDTGVLRIEEGTGEARLRYHLTSRALLFCFLAPLLFLGIAQFTLYLGKTAKPIAHATAASGKAAPAKAPTKPKPKPAVIPMNPIDKALGAPAPEKPGKGDKNGDGDEGDGKKLSPTPAYVFAAIFALLYVAGRVFEDWAVKGLFNRSLLA